MKKLIMLTIIGSSLYAGSLWDIVKNITLTKVNAKGYEISVQGVNIRGYSYHPLMPNGEPNKKSSFQLGIYRRKYADVMH